MALGILDQYVPEAEVPFKDPFTLLIALSGTMHR